MATTVSSPGISRSLLLMPLVTTSASLATAFCEIATFKSLLSAPPHIVNNSVLSSFWNRFLYAGGSFLMPSLLTSAISATVLWQRLGSGVGSGIGLQRKLAGWTAVAAGAHFAFVYPIAKVIERIVHKADDPQQDSRKDIQRWLNLHYVRTVAADLPAFLCAVGIMYNAL